MSWAELVTACAACVVAGVTIMSGLDFLLPCGRREWAPAIGFTLAGLGVSFFLFRFAGVL